MFPARKLAIAVWITAAAVFAVEQFYMPFLFQGSLGWGSGGILTSLNSLANGFTHAGSLASLGAIIHLLGEIRDAESRRRK